MVLLSDGGVVVVSTPATLECAQAVGAGAHGRTLLTLGHRVHADKGGDGGRQGLMRTTSDGWLICGGLGSQHRTNTVPK
jgi:hypothetical protein